MSMTQLNTIHKYESDKEHKAVQQLQLAEKDYQENLIRLQSVGEFRLEYMKRLDQRAVSGVDSVTYRHFHAFVAKLDNAAEQVEIAIKQAKALMEQRKQQWTLQHQKVQAIEKLQEKQKMLLAKKANRAEQAMFDEIAAQQYFRRRNPQY
ncbi:flagellar export protein FliJ [Thalassotalea sp. 1_MG-2023]|uniref:flagellar export protein FliJ n=1 Tax=Thalassotalea sp. 1_MG-2023 TaxID=3062680 RepID=UPI0026E29B8C|nr:flagellar export protein FliJ [Thalassotalea sp. 1_MG-2023]MDO6426468.1 flagellar export protein FliJ [Thalassotalea sp. 1_MG-2023]